MTPDVIVVPMLHVAPEQDPEEVCRRLHIAEEYARRMDWGWAN